MSALLVWSDLVESNLRALSHQVTPERMPSVLRGGNRTQWGREERSGRACAAEQAETLALRVSSVRTLLKMAAAEF